MTATVIPERRLVELRRQGRAAAGQFVDPDVIARCGAVLDRRGEAWAASVLGRDISRRSIAVAHRPYLMAGEEYVLIAADEVDNELAAQAIYDAEPR